jgi:GldM C-terminal domain/GldM N-terminal domain
MSIPKEPRQLMINLMYLVLTALLALNVSREVLNAFANINKSINRSNKITEQKNADNLTIFDRELAKKLDPEKKARIEEGKLKAQDLHAQSLAMVAKLALIKEILTKEAGGMGFDKTANEQALKRPEDIDASTRYMVDQKNGNKMKSDLEAFKKSIAALKPNVDTTTGKLYYSAQDQAALEANLPIDFSVTKTSENKGDWSFANFHQVPAIGAITLIDKYINDVHNAESMVLAEIYAASMGETNAKIDVDVAPKIIKEDEKHEVKIKDEDFKLLFDKYVPIVQPSANYVLPGEKFVAKIMVGAYKEKDNKTTITVNGQPRQVINGVATYEEIASAAGSPERKLVIGGSYYDPNSGKQVQLAQDGKTNVISYFVGAPGASISLDKMNVFYREVDNPISTAASGILLSNLRLTPPAGMSIVPGATVGSYIVDVTNYTAQNAEIGLSGVRGDGQVQTFSGKTYRIKNIPNPVIRVGGKSGGNVPANIFRVQLGPEAFLENFDFDAKFKILDFSFGYTLRKSGEYNDIINNGPLFTQQVKDVMNRLKPKDKVYIENVRVLSPRGKIRNIPGSLTFTMI